MPKGIYERTPVEDRFWTKVDFASADHPGCWVWIASVFQSGLPYGQFQLDGRPHPAHRVAWMLMVGDIPEGVRVLHRCDNPRCVNPDHLFLGSDADNVADMMAKGRHRQGNTTVTAARGESHPKAKITDDQVRAIRDLYASGGYTQHQLALMFGVHQPQISSIVNRRSRS